MAENKLIADITHKHWADTLRDIAFLVERGQYDSVRFDSTTDYSDLTRKPVKRVITLQVEMWEDFNGQVRSTGV